VAVRLERHLHHRLDQAARAHSGFPLHQRHGAPTAPRLVERGPDLSQLDLTAHERGARHGTFRRGGCPVAGEAPGRASRPDGLQQLLVQLPGGGLGTDAELSLEDADA
jgi:hypothetical protein